MSKVVILGPIYARKQSDMADGDGRESLRRLASTSTALKHKQYLQFHGVGKNAFWSRCEIQAIRRPRHHFFETNGSCCRYPAFSRSQMQIKLNIKQEKKFYKYFAKPFAHGGECSLRCKLEPQFKICHKLGNQPQFLHSTAALRQCGTIRSVSGREPKALLRQIPSNLRSSCKPSSTIIGICSAINP